MTDARAARPNKRKRRMPETVKSAVRAIEILEFFDRWRAPALVGTISAELGYPASSTSVLMRSLAKVGYLRYEPGARTYEPTERVPLLGSWISSPLLSDGPVLAAMKRLAQATGQAVALGRRNADCVQWMHIVPTAACSIRTIMDAPPLLHRTAVGQALLSAYGDVHVHGLMHRLNGEAKDLSEVVRIADVLQLVRRIRTDGYACSINGDLGSVARLMPYDCLDRALAIGVVGPAETVQASVGELAAAMQREIHNIEVAKAEEPGRRELPMPANSDHEAFAVGPDQPRAALNA